MNTFSPKRRKSGLALAVIAMVLGSLGLVDRALAGTGGNATNAQLCQKGGWSTLMDASGHQFAQQDACVSYAAHGGAVYAAARIDVKACKDQPYDGLCVTTSGSGLQAGSVVSVTLSKNGSPVREDWPIVKGDGTLDSTPTAHFELPCVAGDEYSAEATGTSAASLSFPSAPGIPITSNTVQRVSACP
jgi:hypothetical protein